MRKPKQDPQSIIRCGNSAAMREALYMMRRISDEMNGETFGKGDEELIKGWAETLRYYSDIALSAPSRNCDRLSADQCKKMFEYEMEVYFPKEATDRDRDIARIVGNGVIDALFAQSTERKGERRWKQVM